ncbi:MAG: hypothetical protein ACYCZ6_05155 [Polaromonas sp.]
MNFIRPIALTAALAFLGSAAWAAEQDDHKAHHPDAAAASSQSPAGSAGAADATTKPPTANMMTAMSGMHDKMMNAKTPEERNALMAEQMKAMPMKEGMGTKGDSKDDKDSMSGMSGMSGMGQGQMKEGTPSDKAPPASK